MSNASPNVPQGRIAQMRQAYSLTKKTDPKIGLLLAATFLVVALVFGGLQVLILGTKWWTIIIAVLTGLLFGLLVTLIIFGRRAEKSMYVQAEGQVGAAGGALTMLKRGWFVKPAIAFNKNQDVVHRVIGRPGVVLIGEGGSSARVRSLVTAEIKKHQRIVGEDTPVTALVVGRGDGEVPLPKLVKKVRKLDKAIKPAQVTDVIYKLKALDASRGTVPMPKGPVPTSMKGQRRAMRG